MTSIQGGVLANRRKAVLRQAAELTRWRVWVVLILVANVLFWLGLNRWLN